VTRLCKARGHWVPGRDGTTLHGIGNGDAYIACNGVAKARVTFGPGKERCASGPRRSMHRFAAFVRGSAPARGVC
jgi:hypothetical protein